MKVDPRNFMMYQDDENENSVFVKREKNKKKKLVHDEFKKQDNRKFKKPKRGRENED